MTRAPLRESLGVFALARPEFGEVVARHDLVFEHGVRPHGFERGLHRRRPTARASARRPSASASSTSRHSRIGASSGGRGAERVELAKRGARLVGPAEGDQRQRPLQMPVARGSDVVGGGIDLVQKRQRLGGSLLLQALGDEVQPRAGIVRVARQRLAQQRLGRIVTAGEAQTAPRDWSVAAGWPGCRLQGAGHGPLGVLDRALRVAREAKIDPGVGEARPQLNGDGEGLLGPRRLAGGNPGLAKSVMSLGPVGLGEARVPRGLQSRQRFAAPLAPR